jgi:hypothetical protein
MEQEFTLGWAQLLAVFYLVEPGSIYATGQDDGCGYHRASQGTPPGFINTSDTVVTLRLKAFFFSEGWFLLIIYQPYPLFPLPLIKGKGN